MLEKETISDTPQLDIICFSSAYWDTPLWTNKQHIMSRISRKHRVLYVEPGLSILGCLRGFTRLQRPWKRLIPFMKRVNSNLYILYLPVLPGSKIQLIEKINQYLVSSILLLLTKLLHFNNPILWFYRPQDVHVVDKLYTNLVCYDCVDEFSEFPTYTPSREKQKIIDAEQELLKNADLVFTTSPHLYETRKQYNPFTYYIPNVADVDYFEKARFDETRIPDEIKHIPSPVIGFVGAVSSYKLDISLIQFIAEAHPDWQIVLVGPIGEGEMQTDLGKLPHYSNVHLLGPRDYLSLPGYIKKFDVCIIPYRLNQYTKGVFPIKFFEFMATGKPIVTTPLPSLLDFADIVSIAHSRYEFVSAIEQLLNQDLTKNQRLKEAKKHSWESRIDQMMALIAERRNSK